MPLRIGCGGTEMIAVGQHEVNRYVWAKRVLVDVNRYATHMPESALIEEFLTSDRRGLYFVHMQLGSETSKEIEAAYWFTDPDVAFEFRMLFG
ncbi:MAG: hypothetical protein EOP83_05095 [Verrucomicrobiaceae bacterium]|nr:MAG: hypothetical protein EOP83_05095 [Verrucomicrobiaceae bacterium]